MHGSEIAGWILGVLAAVFVPAMYWIGRGRNPLGDRRRKDTPDERGDAGPRRGDGSEKPDQDSPAEREDHREDHPHQK